MTQGADRGASWLKVIEMVSVVVSSGARSGLHKDGHDRKLWFTIVGRDARTCLQRIYMPSRGLRGRQNSTCGELAPVASVRQHNLKLSSRIRPFAQIMHGSYCRVLDGAHRWSMPTFELPHMLARSTSALTQVRPASGAVIIQHAFLFASSVGTGSSARG